MKIRNSFFIRWLMTIEQDEQIQSIIDVEHVQSGNKHRAASIEEANEWMKKAGVLTNSVTDNVENAN